MAKVVDGTLAGHALTGIAGVANIGADRNWCGSAFASANWYAFGRLALGSDADSAAIAEEWVRMTFGNDPALVKPVVRMMLGSREAAVDYMTPLGLHHIMAEGHHYGPGPGSTASRGPTGTPSTTTVPTRTASASTAPPRAATRSASTFRRWPRPFGSLERVPEKLPALVPPRAVGPPAWRSGRTLWEELVLPLRLRRGGGAAPCRPPGRALASRVDAERYEQVRAFLAIQEKEARWWRDACVLYFQTFSGRPLPAGSEQPQHDLAYYRAIQKRYVPGS